MRFEKLSDHLYRFHDTCEVYLVTHEDRVLAIDFGTGSVLDHLGEIGGSRIDRIVHTHHHRDQCQGDPKANQARIPIYVPFTERPFFDDVENFWRNRHVYDIYNVRNTFFSLTESIEVAGTLDDYTTFTWEGIDFEVVPTPGHTMGSVSLLATIDGSRVGFTGDLIHAPGKVQTMHDMQYSYAAADGIDRAIVSMHHLARQGLDLICPSHGAPMHGPTEALEATEANLAAMFEFYTRQKPATTRQIEAVTSQVIAVRNACSSFYVLLSRSGKAMFIDYGTPGDNFLQPDLMHVGEGQQRFVVHDLVELRSRFGMTEIDVAIPSHYHDDHICGFPYLQRVEGAKIWSYKNMVNVMERPWSEKVGCIHHEPVRVDRAIEDKETVRWEEFTFDVHYAPGHCDYHMAMFLESDGKRIAFTGDNIFNTEGHHDSKLGFNLIYRNYVKKDDHWSTAKKVLEFEPDIICPGHGGNYPVTRDQLTQFLADTGELQRHFETLVADADTNIGLDPDWVRIQPYQATCKPGETLAAKILIRNHRPRPIACTVALVAREGWVPELTVEPVTVPAGEERAIPFTLKVGSWPAGPINRVAYAVDVTVDGERLGQIGEGLVVLPGVCPGVGEGDGA